MTKKNSSLPAKRTELAKNSEAMRERLAAMRKDRGVKEGRVLNFLCSATGAAFTVAFTRPGEGEKYRIDKIDYARAKGGLFGKLFGKSEAPAQRFSITEFNFDGFACPHCGHRGNGPVGHFFGCGCGLLQCGATIRIAGGMAHAGCHPGCGHTGPLDDTLKSFSGGEGSAEKGRQRLLGSPVKRITGPKQP